MRVVKWDTIMPDVLPEVSEAPKAVVRRHIISASGKFFAETGVWRMPLDPVKLKAGRNQIELLPERGSRIVSILGVYDMTASRAIPRTEYSSDSDVLTLYRTYPDDHMLQISAALKPTRSSEGLQQGMYDDWADAIAYGAIASLKSMRGREWEDLTGAQVKLALFNDYIAEAKGKVAFTGSSETLFMTPGWI
ncbi:hypothetical protein [Halodesulfovibrio sp.]|jgi:hypothetical protein|uniref:hypothetical protein n=1 Tax=Halodesulfovibrio sp. TaxID=1912772 RepID=UPI0025F96148|nr:hypothetical protein [Halodesulfovibrio sp.]MCT4627940.1 hypothetical protein [Halodesulfovibrio sp.]